MFSQRISIINIKGNVFFSDKQLKKIIQSKVNRDFDRIALNNDLNMLTNFYFTHGFINMQVKKASHTIEDDRVVINIEIDEDFQTVINNVRVFGNENISEKDILKILDIKKNEPLNLAYISQKQFEIMDYYALKGYVYADINYEFFDKENKYRKELFIYINEKHKAYIKEIIIDSVCFTAVNVVRYELNMKKGDLYTPFKIFALKQDLFNTGLFKNIDIKANGIDEEKDSIYIEIKTENIEHKWFSGGLIYQFPDRGKVIAGWGNDNVFKNAEKIMIETSFLSDIKFNNIINVNTTYHVPYFIKNFLSSLLRVEYFRDNNDIFKLNILSFNAGLSKNVFKHIISNNYKIKLSVLDTNVALKPIRVLNAATNSTSFRIYHDGRDNIFYPTKGRMYSIETEFAGGVLKGYNNFIKMILEITHYKSFHERVVAGYRLKAGHIKPYGESVLRGVSIDEQFTLGGYSTVRGFGQDSIGPLNEFNSHSGYSLGLANIETRITVYRIIGLVYFFDAGLIKNNLNIVLKDIEVSGGFGVFVNTLIGPIRFDISRPITKTGNLKYYLNIGNSF